MPLQPTIENILDPQTATERYHNAAEPHHDILENKQLLALVAIFLLAPLLPSLLKTHAIEATAEEEAFVEGYIHYGWYIVLVIAVSLVARIISSITHSSILLSVAKIIGAIGIVNIFLGIVCILEKREIVINKQIQWKTLAKVFTSVPFFSGRK